MTTALETSIDFGIFDWIEWDQSGLHEIFEHRLKMLEYADRKDFYCYHLAEHHMTPLSISPSPSVFLSAAAQRTNRIRLGPLVFLLPFYHPVRLLHEICMLDNLSNGRLDLGVGRGIVPMEAEKFDVDLGQSWDMFNRRDEHTAHRVHRRRDQPPGQVPQPGRHRALDAAIPETLSTTMVRQQQHRNGPLGWPGTVSTPATFSLRTRSPRPTSTSTRSCGPANQATA